LTASLDLPTPKLPSLSATPAVFPGISELAAKPPQRPITSSQAKSPSKPNNVRKEFIDDAEADPWGSPALHKGHNHDTIPRTNGIPRAEINGVHEPVRTTSTFTTTSVDDSAAGNAPDRPAEDPAAPTSNAWGSYDVPSGPPFGAPAGSGLGGGGFGDGSGGDGDRPASNNPIQSFGGGRVTGGGVEEIIQISLLPEKEGMFMFQHHNYQVSSSRRGSKVVRRYSDFVWLLDCLQKRYPFRQLPLLPPKRVGGKYLTVATSF
jgi:sorting nexin-8